MPLGGIIMVFERGPLWRRIADYVESLGDVKIPSGSQLILPTGGGDAAPALAFGDGDSGIRENTPNVLYILIDGNPVWYFSAGAFGGLSNDTIALFTAPASATTPGVGFIGDGNTGMGHAAADALTLIAGGVEGIRVAESAGTITLSSPASYRQIQRIPSSQMGLPATNPPSPAVYGITAALEFVLNTEHVEYKKIVPGDWDGTDILVHVHWTKSTANDDQSSKFVKWQLKWLASAEDENCNAGEATLTVEDEYTSAVTTTQLIMQSANVTIPAASLAAHDTLILQLMAVTPAGTPLDDEPAVIAVDLDIGRLVLNG